MIRFRDPAVYYYRYPASGGEIEAGKQWNNWPGAMTTLSEVPVNFANTCNTHTNNNQYQQVLTCENVRQHSAWFGEMCHYQRRKEQ